MNKANGLDPTYFGMAFESQVVNPDAVSSSGATIKPNVKSVTVGAVVTNTSDWIVLPPLASVPNGHRIVILCSAGGAFKMRTPATSNEKINGQDSDGTKQYQMTDTEVVMVTKINNTVGWMANAFSAIGAVVTAVVPA